MSKRIASILICGALGLIFSSEVQAMPVSPAPAHAVTPLVTPVRGFCGLGFHRGPYGYCVRNGVPYGYLPPPPPPRGGCAVRVPVRLLHGTIRPLLPVLK